MNNIIKIENGLVCKDELFSDVRVIFDENKEPLFCLKDVCDNLELTNSRKVKQQLVDEYEKDVTVSYPLITNGGEQLTDFIDEEKLYFLIMRSKKEQAKKFRKWICKEVIPSIRKHGVYVNNQENKTAEQIAIDITKAYTSIIEEKTNKLLDAEKSLELLNKTVEEQKQLLLKQQDQYNTLKQDYIDYASIYEERYRGKIARNKFNTKVNNISKEFNIPQKLIYNAVYYFFFSYRRVNTKIDNVLDYIFSKKEYAQDAYTILERLHREPRAFYYNYIYQ